MVEWLSALPGVARAAVVLAGIMTTAFAGGGGAAVVAFEWRGLPDSVDAVRATQREVIVPRLDEVEAELDRRAAPIGSVGHLEDRFEGFERQVEESGSRLRRNECLLEELIRAVQDERTNFARCALVNGGQP